MRILAVDPGEKRIGLALSDPSGTIAGPLATLKHVARPIDAAAIASISAENGVGLIVIGQALDDEGEPTPQSRKAARLAEAVRLQTNIPVILWDESGSTQAARSASLAMRVSSRKRRRQGHGHLDELAATVILQDYLEAMRREG
jgi:putative Holliday junction resolvase